MQIRLINLDRTPDRLAEFARFNGHLTSVSRFPAIDGKRVDRLDCIERGIIGPALDYTDGALGNALSHVALWDEAIVQNEPLTLCEDDAIFNRHFEPQAERIIQALGSNWHIVLWGWNFDAIAVFSLIPGVSQFLAQFNQSRMRQQIETFQSAVFPPQAFRLFVAFGIPAYTISPAGARLLKRLCLPFDRRQITVPMIGRTFVNRDLSVALLDAFPKIAAFASFPPLVVTKNDHAISTVLPNSN